MQLLVTLKADLPPLFDHIVEYVFQRRFGIPVERVHADIDHIEIRQIGSPNVLRLPLPTAYPALDFLKDRRVRSSLVSGTHQDDASPVESLIGSISVPSASSKERDSLIISADILGCIACMLGRAEEIDGPVDAHGRFPASRSHAAKHGLLERPIADECIEILWRCMKSLWPPLKRVTDSKQSVCVTHDVDAPFLYAFKSPLGLMRKMAGQMIIDREIGSAATAPYHWFRTRFSGMDSDPGNTFDWIMDQSEKRGITSTFYFMSGTGRCIYDGDYDIGHPGIRALIRRIHHRGHKIGLHPSYNSFTDATMLRQEFDRLRDVCAEEKIEQETWDSRQHVLRWKTPQTARLLEQTGVDRDSTLAYADHVGFRCGTCFEYPLFDHLKGVPLKLIERPLIAMELTVLGRQYMGLDREAAYDRLITLRRRCEQVGGTFTLLWHNNRLIHPADRELYLALIS